jgi:tetratricopeptide (TPR) repeat protein
MFTFVLLCTVCLVQLQQLYASTTPKEAEQHHPVSTNNLKAQSFFDQGLTLVYAFNYDAAGRAFQRAAESDPQLAMAYWGIALALGPGITRNPAPGETSNTAYKAVQKALSLAPKASENERAYIEALAKRYSSNSLVDANKLAVDYKNAMGELVKRYPNDLDAATLYAESAMDLRPWHLWSKNGQPAPGTQEIVTVLEAVLKRAPKHLGANHYYIHAVEASPHPERALESAQRLSQLRVMPAAAHLIHMPAHIYMRTGDYAAAARSNEDAIAQDLAYIKSRGGNAAGTFYPHNLSFLVAAYSMSGRSAAALKAAAQLEQSLSPGVPTSTFVLVRFQRWAEILNLPKPKLEEHESILAWHYARGMALAATHRIENAASELKSLNDDKKASVEVTSDDTTSRILKISQTVLSARIAQAKSEHKSAIELLTKAVDIQDTLDYSEPPSWYFPVRESLGGALMLNGNYQEAEKVFRAALVQNPRSGRSLFGLLESLKAQGKQSDEGILRQFKTAWNNADIQLRVEDL